MINEISSTQQIVIFLTIFYNVCTVLRNYINIAIFFMNESVLQNICISLLSLNVTQYLRLRNKKFYLIVYKIFYILYSIADILIPFLDKTEISFYYLLISIPLALIVIFGFYLKLHFQFFKKFLKYSSVHTFYTLIIVIWCLIDSTAGIWYGAIIYSLALYIFSNKFVVKEEEKE